MRHGAKIQQYFESQEAEELEDAAFEWHARRSDAQYVGFKGSDLSVPSRNFDASDAAKIIRDTEAIIAFVNEQMKE